MTKQTLIQESEFKAEYGDCVELQSYCEIDQLTGQMLYASDGCEHRFERQEGMYNYLGSAEQWCGQIEYFKEFNMLRIAREIIAIQKVQLKREPLNSFIARYAC